MKVFIDTELWSFAKKKPSANKFQDKSRFLRASEFHSRSKEFLTNQIKRNEIYMTTHQLAEIFHVLGFRGSKLPLTHVQDYCQNLLENEFMHFYQTAFRDFKEAMVLSIKSGIHVWDYLCLIPFYKEIDVIYSCDSHFQDTTFQELGPPIENPLDVWIPL